MNIRRLQTVLFFFALVSSPTIAAAQVNCEPLKPNPPRNLSTEATGKIDAKLQRFVSFGGSIDGAYKEASSDVLKDYPNADRLYVWDRLIYLNCEGIRVLNIPDSEKFERLNQLADRLGRLPEEKAR